MPGSDIYGTTIDLAINFLLGTPPLSSLSMVFDFNHNLLGRTSDRAALYFLSSGSPRTEEAASDTSAETKAILGDVRRNLLSNYLPSI